MNSRNPFVIDPGGMPPFLAGREQEVSFFARALDSGPLVALMGVRGTGKTVLLRVFEELGAEKGWLTVRVELNERHCRETELLPLLSYHLETRRRALVTHRRRGIGFTTEPTTGKGARTDETVPVRERMADLFRQTIFQCQQLGANGLLLLLDEFQAMRDDKRLGHFGLSTFIEIVVGLRQENVPLFVAIAGLPTLRRNLSEAKTYSERMFSYREIGHLPPPAAQDAMTVPLRGKRTQLGAALVERLVQDTRGYAYLLQFFPFFLLQNALPSGGTNVIDMDDYEALKPALMDRLDGQFYRMRFERCSDDETALLFDLADVGPEFDLQSILRRGRWERNRLNQMLLDLIRKDLLMRIGRGRYGYALPLFDEFLGRERGRQP